MQAFGRKGPALWAPTAGVHLTPPSPLPSAHPFPYCPAHPLPFKNLEQEDGSRAPGQAELNEEEAGGRRLCNDKAYPTCGLA